MVLEQKKHIDVKQAVKRVKVWHLVLLTVLMSIVMMTALRLNNVNMLRRKEAVLNADKSLDVELIESRLLDLRSFVVRHMNTSTGKFFLENLYKQNAQAIIDKAEQDAQNNENGNVYKKVTKYCDSKFNTWSSYMQCITKELDKYPAAKLGKTGKIKLPSPQNYIHEYVAPPFSFDWAGLSVVVWIGLVLALITKVIGNILLLIIIKSHNNGL